MTSMATANPKENTGSSKGRNTSEPIKTGIVFPKEAIVGVAGKFADVYSRYMESPWNFFAFDFLTWRLRAISPQSATNLSLPNPMAEDLPSFSRTRRHLKVMCLAGLFGLIPSRLQRFSET
jgi:hypothetical protein